MHTIYPFSHIYHAIYLLQLENYYILRFLKIAFKDVLLWKPEQRKEIEWTPSLAVTGGLAGLIAVVDGVFVIWLFSKATTSLFILFLLALIIFVALCHFFFVYLAIATALLKPLDNVRKRSLIEAAKKKVHEHPGLTVIAIAGSYGKTTTKEFVTSVAELKGHTLSTRGNQNTPAGISRLILSKLTPETKLLVLEMGEYVPGDVRALCEIAPPDISIITGINEAHLERMGSLENTTRTIFEVVTYAKKDATIILNRDDRRVRENAERFLEGRQALWYGFAEGSTYRAEEISFDEEALRVSYEIIGEQEGKTFSATSALLGRYIGGTIACGLLVAGELGVRTEDALRSLETLEPVKHRLEPKKNLDGTLLIDDSYNGNPEGLREALHVLSRFKNGRKIFITPGLVELGQESARIHRALGQEIAHVADLVVLIKTSATREIKKGLLDAHYPEKNIYEYEGTKEALRALEYERKRGDVLLIQNDWPDNYR
jgi:UDP-N-acetylmuramoyl-tripeptide--D-alanyl-D-alanine ligase